MLCCDTRYCKQRIEGNRVTYNQRLLQVPLACALHTAGSLWYNLLPPKRSSLEVRQESSRDSVLPQVAQLATGKLKAPTTAGCPPWAGLQAGTWFLASLTGVDTRAASLHSVYYPHGNTEDPAAVIAGGLGTTCRAVVLISVACLHTAAASSAVEALSAFPGSFPGERHDRTAGLQAWGRLLGSAVIFNKVHRQTSNIASLSGSTPPSVSLAHRDPTTLLCSWLSYPLPVILQSTTTWLEDGPVHFLKVNSPAISEWQHEDR